MSGASGTGTSGGASRKAPRFLIVRLGSLGDIVHAIPAAAAVRASFPDSRIDWLVDPRYVSLVEMVTAVSHAVPMDPRAGVIRMLATLRELRRRDYSVAIDLQGLVKSAVLARLSGADRVLGFTEKHLREPLARVFYSDRHDAGDAPHVVHKNLALVSALGIETGTPSFPLNVPRTPALEAVEGRFAGAPFALINPGAAWPNKRWPSDRFGALAAAVRDRFGWPSLVLWGPREEALANAVVAASSGAGVLAPSTSIVDLFGIAKAARIAISGDTGPLHIAAAVGTPVVGLFGPTWAKRNGPWDARDVVVSRTTKCDCLYERRCRRESPCIDDIRFEEAMQAVVQRVETDG